MRTDGPPLTRAVPLPALILLILVTAASCDRGQSQRVIVLGIDGLDPATVDLLMSEGKTPNFAQLRQQGAYGRMRSVKPLLSPIIWTTLATGRPLADHGIASFVSGDHGVGASDPVSSDLRQVKAIWNILSENEKKVVMVGWWATWPAEEVNGSIVSDRMAYHFLFPEGTGEALSHEGVTHPPMLYEEIAPMVLRPGDLALQDVDDYISVSQEEFSRPFDFDNEIAHFRWALATALSYSQIGQKLWRSENPDYLAVYIEGVDSTSHLFGHLFRAQDLQGELADQQRRYGNAVEQMYLLADEIVGQYLSMMDDDTTLVVLSDHGFELGALPDDPSTTRDMRRVSERFHREHGVLYLYGDGIQPRTRLQDASAFDVVPTLLTLLSVPPADDMPGRVLDEALDFPLTGSRVLTYETDSGIESQMLAHLESLGYINPDTSQADESTTPHRNIAATLFAEGHYQAAANMYKRLLQDKPDDSALHASYGGVLGALGQFDDARLHLDKAIEIDPLNAEAYHNSGVIAESDGDVQGAIEYYRSAVTYQPGYGPSQNALIRLTGSAESLQITNETEAQAYQMCQQAAEMARRGAYADAMAVLDEAEALAPELAMVYQYKSNVAYLMADLPRAVESLQKALEIQPENALFQRNLDTLSRELEQNTQ